MDIRHDYSGQELGKYYLIEKLGNGGFGAVYRAHDRILGADKAVKILQVTNPSEAFKLFNEASLPYKCKHNHIIGINSGEIIAFHGEMLFVVDMDLANGSSVGSMLKHSRISVVDSLNIIKNILFAVEYSHLLGIIHRDIKPANILIDNGVPKLSDFGLSTALGNVIIPWQWYRTHAAPETFIDDSIATIATDIYALGITLYRMVNGVSDWNLLLQSIPNVEKQIRAGKLIDKLPVAPFVPKKIHKIVKKACRISLEDRYHCAAEMRNAIEKVSPLYNWNAIDDNYWKGFALGGAIKEIYIEPKRSKVSVTITNNGRKSSGDSRMYDSIFEAEQYFYEYIRETTLR